jgi:epoxide hydrolase-like predicted phosphatase
MIKAVVFDAGGVYFRWNYTDFLNKCYEVLGSERRVRKYHIKFDNDITRGKRTFRSFVPEMLGMKLSESEIDQVCAVWRDSFTPYPQMVELSKKLRERYKIAILSNSEKTNMDFYKSRSTFGHFDVLVFSHELGVVKPERRVYEILLERLDMKAEECVFTDDIEAYLVPARDMGMKTIHFRSVSQCKEELKKLGVRF